MTSSHGEDSSALDAYISGGANLFGLLSATVTGSLDLLDKDKALAWSDQIRSDQIRSDQNSRLHLGGGGLSQVRAELQSQDEGGDVDQRAPLQHQHRHLPGGGREWPQPHTLRHRCLLRRIL